MQVHAVAHDRPSLTLFAESASLTVRLEPPVPAAEHGTVGCCLSPFGAARWVAPRPLQAERTVRPRCRLSGRTADRPSKRRVRGEADASVRQDDAERLPVG